MALSETPSNFKEECDTTLLTADNPCPGGLTAAFHAGFLFKIDWNLVNLILSTTERMMKTEKEARD